MDAAGSATPSHRSSSSSSSSSSLVRHSTDLVGENYVQNCRFSPDGLCILTNSVLDNRLRLYNTHGPTTAASAGDEDDENDRAGTAAAGVSWSAPDLDVTVCSDTVRDYVWYPGMDSNEPPTCCFLAASRDAPVHLIDAYTGHIRASYRPINALDELESPTCLLFSQSHPSTFYCAGFRTDRFIHVFDVNRPGRDATTVLRLGMTRRSRDGQKGLVSALAESSSGESGGCSLLAVGTYSPGSIYAYDVRTNLETNAIPSGKCLVGHGAKWLKQRQNDSMVVEDEGPNSDDWLATAKTKWFQSKTQTGVTQLAFGAPGREPYLLYSTSRRSEAVIGWDLRMWRACTCYHQHQIVGSTTTNQRIGFDLLDNNNRLMVGGVDGQVRVYNTKSHELEHRIVVGDGQMVVNGVSTAAIDDQTSYVAVACGSRQFPSVEELENDANAVAVKPGGLFLYKLSRASSRALHSDSTNPPG